MHKQIIGGDCGYYALLHCVEAFNVKSSISELREYVGVSWLGAALHGVEQDDLVEGIREMGWRVKEIDDDNVSAFLHTINRKMKQGYKLIISVEDGTHWAAITAYRIVGKTMLYYCVDSKPKDGHSYEIWRREEELAEWMETNDLCAISIKR